MDRARGRGDQRVLVDRPDQLVREPVERGGSLLALPRALGLDPQARGQAAEDDADASHDRERDEVPGVGDREGVLGRDEEEVVGRDAEDRGRERGADSHPERDQRDPEQEDHHEIGLDDVVAQKLRERERGQDGDRDQEVLERCPSSIGSARAGEGAATGARHAT